MDSERMQKWLTIGLAAGSLIISVLALFNSLEATKISREANQRSSGRIPPYFDVKCETSNLYVKGERAISPDAIEVRITNKGTEPIARVRFDLSIAIVWADNLAYEQHIQPRRSEHEFNRILHQGETATVNILPEVLGCIREIKIPSESQSYWTLCSVACSAQIAGSTYFSAGTKDMNASGDLLSTACSFGVTWDSLTNKKSPPLNFGVVPNAPK